MKIFSKIVSFLLLVSAFQGCTKFLAKEPDNRAAVTSLKTVGQLLSNAYPKGNYIVFCEAMTDNVADRGVESGSNDGSDVFVVNKDSYFWNVVSRIGGDSPSAYWDSCYKAISVANQALQSIQSFNGIAGSGPYKGEALLARAYSHLMIVSLFSKFYTSSTAASDLGIPYVKEVESVVLKQYDRGTVQSVYDNIQADIEEGLPLIDDNIYGGVGSEGAIKFHFNRSAAHALASRFYLYKQDWSRVIVESTAVIPGANFAPNLRPWTTTYQQFALLDQLADFTKATNKANLLLSPCVSVWARYVTTFRYNLTNALAGRIRSNLTGQPWVFQSFSRGGPTNVFFPKFRESFIKSSPTSSFGQAYTIVPLFTVEEALLNRAEAYVQVGDYTSALADLNTYAAARIVNFGPATSVTLNKAFAAYNTTDSKAALLSTVLDFRRSEFVEEGLRWFDILRYSIPVQHISNPEGVVFNLKPEQRQLQIPEVAIARGIKSNPR